MCRNHNPPSQCGRKLRASLVQCLFCLKQQLKGVEIHYLTKKPFVPILENNPYLDKIYAIEKEVAEVMSELKKENYDFIIDLHHNLRSLQVKRSLGKPSASFKKLNAAPLL